MSSARPVRETRHLTDDDVWQTLASTGRLKLVRDAALRLRAADGFSHCRSLAFAISLVLVQGLIALVGLAVEFGQQNWSHTVFAAIGQAVPGPAANLLSYAFAQAQKVGFEHRSMPLLFGLAGTLVTASTAAGQLTRGINRIYGIEKDDPFLRKYVRASALGLLSLAALVAVAAILTAGRGLSSDAGRAGQLAWRLLRWPAALVVTAAAFGGILRWAPRRAQPNWSWLVFGAAVGVMGWIVVTVAFMIAFRASSSFGTVYGPLAGVVALQLWTFCSSVAILFGVALSAQLEAARDEKRAP